MNRTDVENVTVKLPMVISIVTGICMVVIGYFVQAADTDRAEIEALVHKNAEQIAVLVTTQAVDQEELKEIKEDVAKSAETVDRNERALIRIEAKLESDG